MIKSIVIISGYFTGWAALHSLLASLWTKKRIEKIFGQGTRRWYRFFFVTAAVLTLAPLVWLLFFLPDAALYRVPFPWLYFMYAGQVTAFLFLARTIQLTDALDFIGLRDLIRPAVERSDSPTLIRKGLYGLSRHPMYLFSLIVMWLTPTITVNVLTLFICMSAYFFIGSIHEENLLIHTFGNQYRGYQAAVPRIIPWLKLRKPSA